MSKPTYYHSHFLNYYSNTESDKLTDPISTIVRLAMLGFKQEGTKISVGTNKIVYSRPNVWLWENIINYQGIVRGIKKYSRDDIIYIYPAILRTMCWWDDNSESHESHECIKTILQLSISGLKKLNNLYQDRDGRAEMFITHCQSKIDEFIKNSKIEYDELDEKIILDEKLKEKLFDANKLLWSDKEINIITNRLKLIHDHFEIHKTIDCSAITKYIMMIEKILGKKDTEFKKILAYNDINTIINPK